MVWTGTALRLMSQMCHFHNCVLSVSLHTVQNTELPKRVVLLEVYCLLNSRLKIKWLYLKHHTKGLQNTEEIQYCPQSMYTVLQRFSIVQKSILAVFGHEM